MIPFYDLSEIVNKTSPLLSKANELAESRSEKVLNYDESIVKNKTFIEHLDSNQENLSSDSEKACLTDTEKSKLKIETGWPDEIIDSIKSLEEAQIYIDANLKVSEINGKICLTRTDIDLEQKDEFGRTNKERMENGQPPLTKSGETIELHHIGQQADSPLAELTTQEHRGTGYDLILHDKQKESEIDRNVFKKEREQHWKDQAASNPEEND